MSKKDIKEILSKTLEISQKQIFTVRIYRPNEPMYEIKRINYLELGLYLTRNVDIIERILIYMSE